MRRAQRAMRVAATNRTSANEIEVISRTEAILRAIERATRLVSRSHLRLLNLEREVLVQEAAVTVIRDRDRLHLFDSEDMPSQQWFDCVVRHMAANHLRRMRQHEELLYDLLRDISADDTEPADNSPLSTQTFQQLRHSIPPARERFLTRAKKCRNKVMAKLKFVTFSVAVMGSMVRADKPTALCVAS